LSEIRTANDSALLKHAVITLVAAINQVNRALATPQQTDAASAANDNDKVVALPRSMPSDPMTLRQVKAELRLTEKQIVTLRRLWSFPVPSNAQGYLVFSRQEVGWWAKRQPDPGNLAAVLRLRRRDNFGVGREGASHPNFT
jgi:hypothetical protein